MCLALKCDSPSHQVKLPPWAQSLLAGLFFVNNAAGRLLPSNTALAQQTNNPCPLAAFLMSPFAHSMLRRVHSNHPQLYHDLFMNTRWIATGASRLPRLGGRANTATALNRQFFFFSFKP
jgi:hypothetical protein